MGSTLRQSSKRLDPVWREMLVLLTQPPFTQSFQKKKNVREKQIKKKSR